MTMSGNSSTQQGGGFRNTSNGIATFQNCLIAANFDNGNGPDIWAHGSSTINDNGNNLIGDTTGVHNLFHNTTLKGGPANQLDPMFVESVSSAAYPNNSGDLRLQCSSSAVNAGDSMNISSTILTTDVFGDERYIGVVDIGAYEAGGNKKLTVLNSSDTGYGTLRNAVAASCDGDTICFHPDTDGQTIFMTSAKMEVEKNLTIIGNGIDQTIIDGDNTDHIMFSIKGCTCSYIK